MAGGKLTTHVLDTSSGRPGAGLRIDLYRLAGEDEMEYLGFDEFLYGEGLTVIEWPDRLGAGSTIGSVVRRRDGDGGL